MFPMTVPITPEVVVLVEDDTAAATSSSPANFLRFANRFSLWERAGTSGSPASVGSAVVAEVRVEVDSIGVSEVDSVEVGSAIEGAAASSSTAGAASLDLLSFLTLIGAAMIGAPASSELILGR